MSARKIIIYFILTLLFIIYFYTITSDYINYKTVTNVDRIRKRSEMPQISDAFCVSMSFIMNGKTRPNILFENQNNLSLWMSSTYDEKEMGINLSVNNRSVKIIGDPFRMKYFKCWTLEYEHSYMIEEEIFQLKNKPGMILAVASIYRNLKKVIRKEEPSTLIIFNWRPEMVLIPEMFVLNSLPGPFETDCHDYEISQSFCYQSCVEKVLDSADMTRDGADLLDSCSISCFKDDCLKLVFHQRVGMLPDVVGIKHPIHGVKQSSFGGNSISITSIAMFPLSLSIQQSLGLITMFFEVMVLDFLTPAYMMIFYVLRIRRIDKRHLGKRKRKMWGRIRRELRKSVLLFIASGCCAHVIFHINHFMQYRTSTEAYIGEAMIQRVPTMGVCFPHNKPMNMTYREIDLSTPKYNSTLTISFGDEQKPLRILTYFIGMTKCFAAVPTSIASKSVGKYLASITILNMSAVSHVYDIATGLNNDVPRDPPHFRIIDPYVRHFATTMVKQDNLPHPYGSNCINYDSIGCMSRPQCVDECIIQNFINAHAQFPASIVNTHHFDQKILNDLSINRTFCERFFIHPQCHEIRLNIASLSYNAKIHQQNVILLRSNHLTSIKLIPDQSVIDFLTFTASLLSLWFGFSGLYFIDQLPKLKLQYCYYTCVKLLVQIILIAFSLAHLHTVIVGFVKYEIVSSVTMGTAKLISLPTISLGFNLNDRTMKTGIKSLSNISYVTMPPYELNQLFFNAVDIVKYFSIPSPLDYTKSVTLNTAQNRNIVQSSILSKSKIITIDLMRLGKKFRYDSFKGKIFGIEIRFDFGPKFTYQYEVNQEFKYNESSFAMAAVHIHSFFERSNNDAYFWLKEMVLSTQVMKTKLLKYPYGSDCIDYVDPYKSNYTYFHCMVNQHRINYGKIPNDISIPSIYGDSRMKSDSNISKNCHSMFKAKPVCESLDYVIITSRRRHRLRGDLFILLPTEQTSSIYVPKTSILDLVILMADVLGLWLGISLGFILNKISSMTHCNAKDNFLIGH